ncbi:phage tail protein I [Escherichia coli]
MTVKAKRFRIGVEGATTDGREIQREWLEQMAASYNPAVYTALINLEHIKSYLPDSTFTCPVSFLPYLAWAFSVDRWDEGWTESVKRQVVKDAFYIHQHKGTTSAVRRVVEPFGFLIRIIEWWQTGETPGTFRLDIGVQDQGITEDTYLELERLISDAKPCSRHMIGMSINLQTSGPHWVGAASYLGEEITIYPYINETIISGGTAHEGGAVHVIDTMRVNP